MEQAPAVLLIGFNRPAKFAQVLDAVSAAEPAALYVALDGPRPGSGTDGFLADECARLVRDRDWSCRVEVLRHSRNLGCKRGVVAAIDWFFEHVDSGIILEDDCLPARGFFGYCAELLARYADSPRVMMIGGHNVLGRSDLSDSYAFSSTTPIWGWATWARAWRLHDKSMASWDDENARAVLRSSMPAREYTLAARRFDLARHHHYDTWDFAWEFTVRLHGGLSAVPQQNLVNNIGFDDEATHTSTAWPHEVSLPVGDLPMPLRHPARLVPDAAHDQALFAGRFPPARLAVELGAARYDHH